jgi:hypothetical protein
MPPTQPPRTPSAKVEGRDEKAVGKTPKENFDEMAKRLLSVTPEELKREIEKFQTEKSVAKSASQLKKPTTST